MTFDLIIRGGRVVDGTGGPARTADVAVRAGRIAEIGKITGRGAREVSADGALVTPGWVDIHTHYDGQVTWDRQLAPSSWHGVTTVVMGSCGVGFAPVRERDHDQLIELMEGVEDIPGTALHEGIAWGWQTFPDYLDVLAGLARDIDFAAMVPHSALRLFVMGGRGARREPPATADDIAAMGQLAQQAVEAGAVGFTTDRLGAHRTSQGDHTPAFGSAHEECIGIAAAIGRGGTGVLQAVLDFDPVQDELELLRSMSKASGRPLSFTLTYRQNDAGRLLNRRILEFITSANADGQRIAGQVAARAIGFLYGLQCSLNPFSTNPVFQEIAGLRPEEQARVMAGPGFRQRLLTTQDRISSTVIGAGRVEFYERMFELADPPDYEPDVSQSIAARAAAAGRSAQDMALDIMIKDDGRGMLYVPGVNYRDGNLDVVGEMLAHRFTIPGLSDGGAHVGTICDASYPTTLLEYWGRDRTRGKLDVPFIVQRQCRDTAWFFGLRDRGVLAPGYRADINVIDFERLCLRRPEVHFDLPAGGRRLLQRAEGYRHTFVSGEETYRDGQPTGQLPGRLVRGAQPAAAGRGRQGNACHNECWLGSCPKAGAGPAYPSDLGEIVHVSRFRRRTAALAGAMVLVPLFAAACSSSGSSTTGSSAGATGNGSASSSSAPGVTASSISLGLLTSLTGPTAAGFTTVPTGFEARIDQQNAEGGVDGRKINVVLGDDQGTTSGALSAAQTLVEQKNVFALGMISITGYGAAPYLTKQNVPVTGTPLDGPEWAPPNNNMFPTSGSPSPKFPAPSTYGSFFKGQGATNIAAVAYNSPTAAAGAKNVQSSVEAVGLKSTYINSTIPFTQEGGFGSIVQQMKQEHVDGIYIEMQPTANFALLEAMRQAGMNVKAYLMDISPPAAIFQNSAAASAAQGTWVPSHWVPIALQTPAVKAFQAALATYAHQTTLPDENEYDGWAAADLLIKGLQVAGKNPTRSSFETALRAVTNYNAGGLLVSPANMTTSFGTGAEGPGPYSQNCYYYSQYKGTAWVPNAQPICGPLVPNSDAG